MYPERAAEIEAGAIELLAAIGNPAPPIDAMALADAFGLAVKRGFPGIPDQIAAALRARLLQDRHLIEVAPSLRGRALHEAVAHELGHWALWQLELPQSELAADMMGAALMMPWRHFDRQAPMEAHLDHHLHCTIRLIEVRRQALALTFSPASLG